MPEIKESKKELVRRIIAAINEIGVPQPGYPQNVANAYNYLKYGSLPDESGSVANVPAEEDQ